jgi:hypothetical protein
MIQQEWMSKLTGGLLNNSNSVKDLDDKVAASLEQKGVIRIEKGIFFPNSDSGALCLYELARHKGIADGGETCVGQCIFP